MSFSSPSSPPPSPSPSPEPIGTIEESLPTPTPTPTDEGKALAPPDVSTDEPILTDIDSGADQLLSTAFPHGLSDPYSSAQGGWIVGSQEVDPFTNVAAASGTLYPFAGQEVDPFTNEAADGINPNAYTGNQNDNPFTSFQNAVPPGAIPADTSQMLASNGPIPASDSASAPLYASSSELSGQTPIDRVTINDNMNLPAGTYAHYQVTIDGVTYDGYVNDKLLPGQVLLEPASSPAPPAATPSAVAQVPQSAPAAPTPVAAPTPAATPTSAPPTALSDLETLSIYDFSNKYGVSPLDYFRIIEALRPTTPLDLSQLSKPDTTLYWGTDGRIGTAQDLAERGLGERLNFQQPSAFGAAAGLAARAFTNNPDIIGALQSTGDLFGTGLSGFVVARNQIEASTTPRAFENSALPSLENNASPLGTELQNSISSEQAQTPTPRIINSNVLSRGADQGNANALAAIRAGQPVVTLSQLREFLDVSNEVQQTQRAQFLLNEGVVPLSTQYGQLSNPQLAETFWRIANQQGADDTTGDAALVIHGLQSGFPIVTGDGRLIRMVGPQTLQILGVTFIPVTW